MLKYSNASEFNISIENDENFHLKIADNGVGMSATETKSDDNYGLYNMRKRSEDIGAMISIESAIGKGVVIEVQI